MVSRRAFSRAGVAPRLLKLDLAIATESGPHRVWATFRRGKDTKRVSMSKACAFWTYRPRDPCQNSLFPPRIPGPTWLNSPPSAFLPRPAFSSTTPLPHPAAVWPQNPGPSEHASTQIRTARSQIPDSNQYPAPAAIPPACPAARHLHCPSLGLRANECSSLTSAVICDVWTQRVGTTPFTHRGCVFSIHTSLYNKSELKPNTLTHSRRTTNRPGPFWVAAPPTNPRCETRAP